MSTKISALYYYPVKSLGGIQANSLEIDDFGFKNDRRFMLVDDNNKFVSQRTMPVLNLLQSSLISDVLSIFGDDFGQIDLELDAFGSSQKVMVWSDEVDADLLSSTHTRALSEYLGQSVRLAYIPQDSFRQVDREFFAHDQRVSFADGYPFLLTNESSLTDLNNRLAEPVTMARFRPNIVVSGTSAFEEDKWVDFELGGINFKAVKPCSRCVMTTVENGVRSKEPLRELSKYRRNDFGICFGQNLVHLGKGKLSTGDKLRLL